MKNIIAEINDLKCQNKKMKILIAELEASNEKLERYAYIISHDLKAPLRSISSYSSLIQRRFAQNLDKEAMTFLRFIIDNSKTMASLISDNLNEAKFKSSQLRSPVDLNKVVEKVLRILTEELKSVSLEVEQLPSIMASHTQMLQLFLNLLTNAIKFRKSNVPLHINIRYKVSDQMHHFTVSDNGIGIPTEKKQEIFRWFKQGKDHDGHGIGLFNCKSIIESYGGFICVESNLKKGSEFHFYLPDNNIQH